MPSLARNSLHNSRGSSMRRDGQSWASRWPSYQTVEDVFINALVSASTCREHTYQLSALSPPSNLMYLYRRGRRKQGLCQYINTRGLHGSRSTGPVQRKPWEVSKRELKGLVDIYGTSNGDPSIFLPRRAHQEDPPQFYRPILPQQVHPVPPLEPMAPDVESQFETIDAPRAPITDPELPIIEELTNLLLSKRTSHTLIYDTYMQLEYPRAARLPYSLLKNLMQHLAVRDRRQKDEAGMQRYLSIMDEMKETGVRIERYMWNTAMSYAAHALDWINESDAESILSIWREMEQGGEIKGNEVTLTIVYDVAVKAGKFALADEIWREFGTRNLVIDRVARVAQIYAYGLRKDGDKVRRCYVELVESGEIVDTTVLNCVITSLINAGEGPAAEEVFGRMKAASANSIIALGSLRNWREERETRQLLGKAAQYRNDRQVRDAIQNHSPLAPDRHTYRALIRYHAIQRGNINRAMSLASEMLDVQLPLDYSIFSILFRGFGVHGRYSYSEWTSSRLQSTWQAFLEIAENDADFMRKMDRWLVEAIVEAFAICVSKERALDIWESILEKWTPTPEALDAINTLLKKNFRHHTGSWARPRSDI